MFLLEIIRNKWTIFSWKVFLTIFFLEICFFRMQRCWTQNFSFTCNLKRTWIFEHFLKLFISITWIFHVGTLLYTHNVACLRMSVYICTIYTAPVLLERDFHKQTKKKDDNHDDLMHLQVCFKPLRIIRIVNVRQLSSVITDIYIKWTPVLKWYPFRHR